ncbi:MAG: DUF881 domain-containing protein [Actinomycetota bacterium]
MTTAGDRPDPWVERRRHDRSDVLSTSLLMELTTITVDPAYVEAAARRAARGESPPDFRTSSGAAVMLVLLGLLAAVAFSHTRKAAPATARVRRGLVARIQHLTKQTDAAGTDLEELRQQVADDRDRALAASAADRQLAQSLRSLETAAAATAVSGPGVVLRLSDAPPAADTATRVQDRDLQRAVNIAWSAGAEAVAVNGQRLGPLTAIRQAGDSILVDYRPVASPYVVRAIGDQGALELAFTVGDASSTLRAVARSLDFGYAVERGNNLQLAGTSTTRVVVATPAGPRSAVEGSLAP